MKAKELSLKNFRNYREQSIAFDDGINILTGDNAQGKTNVLEAIYLFSMGKSGRARRDEEMIYHGEGSAELSLTFEDGERECASEITLFKGRRKAISVNQVPVRKNSELVGRFRVVYFGPEYLSLVKEGPKQRRKNMDILISQLRPKYFSAISDAKKIVESKNALLKMDSPNQAMIDILNEKLAGLTSEIICYRREYIKKVHEKAREIQKEISGGKEDLEIRYLPCIDVSDNPAADEIKERLKKKLDEVKRREIDSRESTVGPHREDIEYLINGQEAKKFASQGQQKTIVLVQKLAEVALIKEESGDLPVLLLDDIMSELDKKRQSFILNHIGNMQIIITCTDTDGFDMGENTKIFLVEDGKIKEQEM